MEGKVVTPPRARSVVCHARLLWGYFYSERTGILQGRENRHSGIERPVMRWKHSEGVCSRVLEDVITDSPGCIPEYDLSNQVWYPVIPDYTYQVRAQRLSGFRTYPNIIKTTRFGNWMSRRIHSTEHNFDICVFACFSPVHGAMAIGYSAVAWMLGGRLVLGASRPLLTLVR